MEEALGVEQALLQRRQERRKALQRNLRLKCHLEILSRYDEKIERFASTYST